MIPRIEVSIWRSITFARPVTPLLTTVSLALLAGEPLHAYELKKRTAMALGKMITVSEGSLYPLLRALEKRGAISGSVEPAQNGRPDRVVYAITEAGLSELDANLSAPLAEGLLGQTDFYIRVACFGRMDVESRKSLISERRARLCGEAESLHAARESISGHPWHLELAALRSRQVDSEIEWLDEIEKSVSSPKEEVHS